MAQNYFDTWKDYQLIDSGSYEKLERFGEYFLIRPEKSATWKKNLSDEDWIQKAHARYNEITASTGTWEKIKNIPESWQISYPIGTKNLIINLKLKNFKHIGIFPEQAVNWNYIFDFVTKSRKTDLKILNLFAYTGLASLAAKAAGAEVTHIDSIKQIIAWSKENQAFSGLENIRFLVDDSVKFVKKEIRRNNFYNGIILDPPTFGLGPDGERWILERDLSMLISLIDKIIDKRHFFIMLNFYSSSMDKNEVQEILKSNIPVLKKIRSEEIFLTDKFNKKIPAGMVFIAEKII